MEWTYPTDERRSKFELVLTLYAKHGRFCILSKLNDKN